VRRPESIANRFGEFSTPDWKSSGFGHSYCPRDLFLAIGNTLIECPMVLRARFFESLAYKNILLEYFKAGTRWISAPKPRLLDEMYNPSNPVAPLNNFEPAFDAANVLRAGKDLFYLVSSSGNNFGYQWLTQTIGDTYRIHPCYNLYNYVHIDSTLCLLRPGLVLINPSRVTINNLPKPLQQWEVVASPEMVDIGLTKPYTSTTKWIGMNLLMVNSNLAIVDQHQLPLIRLLEKYKIDVIPLSLRHARALGGGFHCVTLDTRRSGTMEDYFS
jgi:scyllo-inosamine-4-phosphate amidinotransferase 1